MEEYIKNDLYSNDEKKVFEALEEIQKRKDSKFITDLIEILKSTDSLFIKEKVIEVLGEIIDSETIYYILPLLVDSEPYIRNAATKLLKENQQLIFDYLKELIHDQDKDIRKYTLDALFNYKFPDSAKIIREALNDSNINNVIAACEYLGKLKDYESKEKIEKILIEANNNMLIHACIEALAEIGDDRSIEIVYEKILKINSKAAIFSFFRLLAGCGNNEKHIEIALKFFDSNNALLIRYFLDAVVSIIRKLKNKISDTLRKKLYEIILDIYENLRSDVDKANALELIAKLYPDDRRTFEIYKKEINSDEPVVITAILSFLPEIKIYDNSIIDLLKHNMEYYDFEMKEFAKDILYELKDKHL